MKMFFIKAILFISLLDGLFMPVRDQMEVRERVIRAFLADDHEKCVKYFLMLD